MEHVRWIVQHWVVGYAYWSDCTGPADRYGPVIGYDNESDARDKLDSLRREYLTEDYRLIKRTVTEQVIA